MKSRPREDTDEHSEKSIDQSTADIYEYNFLNIFRLGMEQIMTHKKSRHSIIAKKVSKSGKAAPGVKPKGFFLHKEKIKDVITLDNRAARFTAYGPKLFSFIREIEDVSDTHYLQSLCSHPIQSMSGSSGKSGSNFYISTDKKFVVKTLTLSEKDFLLKILKSYSNHLYNKQHSLLSIFYGLYKITFIRGKATEESWAPLAERKIFVIMNNVFGKYFFDSKLEKFDLKGTTEERFVDVAEDLDEDEKNKTVKKDINFEKQNHILSLNAVDRVLLTEQIRRDVEFLQKHKIMDYSFLVGIKVVEKDIAKVYRKTFKRHNFDFDILSDLKLNGCTVFQLSGGGVVGESREREIERETKVVDELYLFGIIDTLQPYNLFKKTAHQYKKQIKYAFTKVELDTVRPDKYAKRFLKFLNNIIICKDYNSLSKNLQENTVGQDDTLNTSEIVETLKDPTPK
eukprot:GAHX01001274.1.p1 GENE.GAHX01001274.1~~GAHX01001274.1.p1  ORF type:complete len:454 (-),score=92.40 GAHX01001274.1:1201-2562(-)